MSEQASNMAEQVPESSSGEKPVKKLKQLRLPFAPIQKNLGTSPACKVAPQQEREDDGAVKKRKHSDEGESFTKKPALEVSEPCKILPPSKENGSTDLETLNASSKCPPNAKNRTSLIKEKKEISSPGEEGVKKRRSGGKALLKETKDTAKNEEESSKNLSNIETVPPKKSPVVKSNSAKKNESVKKGLAGIKKSEVENTCGSEPSVEHATNGIACSSDDGSKNENAECPRTPTTHNSSLLSVPNTGSPAVIDHLKHKLKVEIAKIVVQVLEFKAQLEKAVDDQEFLKAQDINEKLKDLQKTKDDMTTTLEAGDAENIRSYLASHSLNPSSDLVTNVTNSSITPILDSPSTVSPRRKRVATMVTTPGSTTPTSEPIQKMKKLTPKQLALRAEIEKRKDEREKQRQEIKKAKEEEKSKKEAERKEKEKERLMKKLEEETLKKQREEEKERQRVEREKLKEQERKEKEESKKLRELEKIERQKLKEIEREQKEVERKQQEALEKKKTEKVSQSFISFFVKKDSTKQDDSFVEPPCDQNNFALFRIKKDMRIAPISRNKLDDASVASLDGYVRGNAKEDVSNLFLEEIRSHGRQVRKSCRTWPPELATDASNKKNSDENDVEIVEEDDDEEDDIGDEVVIVQADKMVQRKQTMRAKLLQFHDNQRPPYWGTWSKKSNVVGPRRPFALDMHFFDYDYDSDDDWEEEEQGESLSDEEKDKEDDEDEEEEKEENNEEDDGFFVGHGVLGKDELHPGDDSDECEFDAELEMKKQKLRAQEFEKEYKKKKTTKLKPRVYGPLFLHDPNDLRPQIVVDQLLKIFSKIKAVPLCLSKSIPTSVSHPTAPPSGGSGSGECGDSHLANAANGNGQNSSRKAKTVPEESVPDLIRLIHANTCNKIFLAREFVEFWKKKTAAHGEGSGMKLPQSKVITKIQEIADYNQKPGVMMTKGCWIVKQEVLTKYAIDKLDIPNAWEYILEVPTRLAQTPVTPGTNGPDVPADTDRAPPSSAGPGQKPKSMAPASLITKFTKVLTEEDRHKVKLVPKPSASAQVSDEPVPLCSESPVPSPSPSPSTVKTKKRIQPTLLDLAGPKTTPKAS